MRSFDTKDPAEGAGLAASTLGLDNASIFGARYTTQQAPSNVALATGYANPLMFGQYSNAGSSCATPSFNRRAFAHHLGSSSFGTINNQQFNDSMASSHVHQHAAAAAAAGHTTTTTTEMDDLEDVEISNVVTMVCFATALMENLARINRGKFLC